MKEALYWKKLRDKVQCLLCPWECIIEDSKRGFCGIRENQGGVLYSLVYEHPVAVHVDPIEKKPLYHFLPGSTSFSIGTVGCNMSCLHCQNYDISRGTPESVPAMDLKPEQAVEAAIRNGCESISYTYNEPTVFFEYILECAKLAKKKGLRNVMVTNGYINPEPLKELLGVIDAANVDLKAFNEKFYKEVSNARLQPVLDSLKLYRKIWLEVTNLIIPTKNDSLEEIEAMCRWIADNLGRHVPLHFSRFFPMYKMQDLEPTPLSTLQKAKQVAEKYLDFVYLGNVETGSEGNTYCPKCKNLLISRNYYKIENLMKGQACKCGNKIAGVF